MFTGCEDNNLCRCRLVLSSDGDVQRRRRVVVGEGGAVRASFKLSNKDGVEPAFGAILSVAYTGGIDLPKPRGLDCRNLTANTVGGGGGGAGGGVSEAGEVSFVFLKLFYKVSLYC